MLKNAWIVLSTCLSIHVSIYTLSMYMMKDAWIVLSTCLSIHASIYTLSIHDERRLNCPVYLSIYSCVYIYLIYT